MKPVLKPLPGNRSRIPSSDRDSRCPADGDFATQRYRLYHMAQQRASQSFENTLLNYTQPSVSSQPTQSTQGPINFPRYHYGIKSPPYWCSGKRRRLSRRQPTGSQNETQSSNIKNEPLAALTETLNEIDDLLDYSDNISSTMKKEKKWLQMSIRSISDTMDMKRKEATEIMEETTSKLREAVEKQTAKNLDNEDEIPQLPDLDLSELRKRFAGLRTTADNIRERLQRLQTVRERRETPMSVLLQIEKIIDSNGETY